MKYFIYFICAVNVLALGIMFSLLSGNIELSGIPKSNNIQESQNEPVVSDGKSMDELLKQRLVELKSESKTEHPEGTDKKAITTPHEDQIALDESCFVKVGNYSQPKFGFDSDCQPLPNKFVEKKTALTLNKLPDSVTVNFKAENERDVIYVFTDYTCPYCRKLHGNVEKFNQEGIIVKYILYPRYMDYGERYSEKAKEVVDNMTYAFCSTDHRKSFHDLYVKGYAEVTECSKENGRIPAPIREHYILSHMIDIKHTPAIVSSKGKLSYGFSSVYKTLSSLGIQ